MDRVPTDSEGGYEESPTGRHGLSTAWLTALAILPVAAVAALILSLRPLWTAYQMTYEMEDLLSQLDAAVPETWEDEIAGLAMMGEHAIDSVAPWLSDPDVTRRQKAVLVLAQISSQLVVPYLLQALHDEDNDVGEIALNGLLRLCLTDPALAHAVWESAEANNSGHSGAVSRPSDPEAAELFEGEVQSLLARRKWRQVCKTLDRIIQKEPDFGEAYFQRAKAFYYLGDYDASLRDCQETLRYVPSHFGALMFMGMCYLRESHEAARYRNQQWALARDAFIRALAVHAGVRIIESFAQPR